MVFSHIITMLSWFIFIIAGLSFCEAMNFNVVHLMPQLDWLIQIWRKYTHAPLFQFIGQSHNGVIDLGVASLVTIHSLFRQKSRLNRIHKDLAVSLVDQPDAAETLGMSFNVSDTKAVNKLMEQVKSQGLQADAPNLPRSNWAFTTQSLLMVALMFSASVWLFIHQII